MEIPATYRYWSYRFNTGTRTRSVFTKGQYHLSGNQGLSRLHCALGAILYATYAVMSPRKLNYGQYCRPRTPVVPSDISHRHTVRLYGTTSEQNAIDFYVYIRTGAVTYCKSSRIRKASFITEEINCKLISK